MSNIQLTGVGIPHSQGSGVITHDYLETQEVKISYSSPFIPTVKSLKI